MEVEGGAARFLFFPPPPLFLFFLFFFLLSPVPCLTAPQRRALTGNGHTEQALPDCLASAKGRERERERGGKPLSCSLFVLTRLPLDAIS